MFNHHVFSKSCNTSVPSAKLIAQGDKPYLFFEVAMRSASHCTVSFFNVGMGVTSIVLLSTSFNASMAQTILASEPGQVAVKAISQVNTLFVNPSVGDDKVGNGTEATPLKTITQALRLAKSNTVIMLSKGTYSTETGEKFPLMLKPDVSIQGHLGSKGRDVVIQGGGEYLSRTFGGKNVTIIGANSAGLTGVTVTNTNPRGYGLWIEYSSPVIAENTFTGSTQDGIAVTGNAQPSIHKNYFYRNGANGITLSGNSRALLRENVFQETGFGVNIAQNAEPTVVGNQIKGNRFGIVVQAHAHPILRSNLIQDSKEDGLVAIAQAIPDLGSASEPGANEFRNNTRYDINASAAQIMITAYGNTLKSINGKVDTKSTATLAQNSQPATMPDSTLAANQRIASVPSNNISPNNSASKQLNTEILPLKTPIIPVSLAAVNTQPSTDRAGFAPPNSLTEYSSQPSRAKRTNMRQGAPTARTTAEEQNTAQLNYVQVSPNTIEFTAPHAVKPQRSAPVQKASTQKQSLPVPSAPVPRVSSQEQSLPVPSAPVPRVSPQEQSLPVLSAPVPRVSFQEQSLPVLSAPVPRVSFQEQSFPVPSAPVPRVSFQEQSFPVPSAPVPISTQGQPLPVLEAAPVGNTTLLPVPNSNVPKGNTSNMRKVPGSQTATVGYGSGSKQLAMSAAQIDLRFRVVVETGTEKQQQIVKSLAPGAFRTVWRGREVMQVGVFSSRYNAENMVRILNQNGLKSVVEPIN